MAKFVWWFELALSLLLTLVGAFMVAFWGIAGAIGVVPVGIIAGLLFWRTAGSSIADKFSMWLLFAEPKRLTAPEEYPLVRSKIVNADFAGAIADLEELRARKPESRVVINMLTDIYIDELKDYQKAYDTLADFLESSPRVADDYALIMKAVDLFLDTGHEATAIALLEREILQPVYKPGDLARLKERLAAFGAR